MSWAGITVAPASWTHDCCSKSKFRGSPLISVDDHPLLLPFCFSNNQTKQRTPSANQITSINQNDHILWRVPPQAPYEQVRYVCNAIVLTATSGPTGGA